MLTSKIWKTLLLAAIITAMAAAPGAYLWQQAEQDKSRLPEPAHTAVANPQKFAAHAALAGIANLQQEPDYRMRMPSSMRPGVLGNLRNIAVAREWYPHRFGKNEVQLVLPEADAPEVAALAANPVGWVEDNLEHQDNPNLAGTTPPDTAGALVNVSIRVRQSYSSNEMLLVYLSAAAIISWCVGSVMIMLKFSHDGHDTPAQRRTETQA